MRHPAHTLSAPASGAGEKPVMQAVCDAGTPSGDHFVDGNDGKSGRGIQTGTPGPVNFRDRNPYETWEAENSAAGYALWTEIRRAELLQGRGE